MRMQNIQALGALVLTTALSATATAQTWQDFQVGGTTRKAIVYVPSGIDHPPLLLSLHGMGIGAGWNQAGMMKFEPIADREKFVVVYPEADQNLRWDLGGTHDTDFVLKIIEDMSAEHGIDTDRIYASGFSMGGMFSYTLACKLPDKIAAIAPGDGYPLGGESGCVTTRPVPIFHMHGTADDFVPYSGIHAFLKTKVTQYGCPATPVRTEPYPIDKPDSQSFKEYWGPCTNGKGQTSEIILISVTGMIHDWATAGKANANTDPAFSGKPFDIDGSEEAWAFLKTHSLSGSIAGPGDAGAEGSSDAGASCPGRAENAYRGNPPTVPGTVEAEDFDPASYFDSTSGNEGGEYRAGEDVDIKAIASGYAIGWMTSGEWLEYTVNVTTAGEYRATFTVGAVDPGRTFDVSVCGAQVTSVEVPQVAAWGELASASTALPLDAGLQVIRVTVGASDYMDFDSMKLELVAARTDAAEGGLVEAGAAPAEGGSIGADGGSTGAAGDHAPVADPAPSEGSPGCACRLSAGTHAGSAPALIGILGFALRIRRRRTASGPC
jgi:MYXO-CTERM domain-containing protein